MAALAERSIVPLDGERSQPGMKRRAIIAYSAGSLGTALSMQCFNTVVPYFYVDVLKLTPALFATAMTIYAIWNAINDPLAGQISDRTRTRWGRRIPYILFLTLPMVLLFTLVWTPPFRVEHGQMMPLFIYFLLVICLFDGLWTFVILNWTALFPEMYQEGSERAQVSGWRQVFSIIGLIIGVAMPLMVAKQFGYAAMGIGFGLITAISLYVSLLGSKENLQYSQEESLGLGDALKATLRNRSFLLFLGLNIFISFCFEILTGGLPFYAKYVLLIDEFRTSLLLGVALIGALPMLALWTWLCSRRGARTALLLSQAAFALGLLPLLFVRGFAAAIVVMVVMSVGFAGLLMLTDVLIADIVDEDELKTGVRREGMFFGLNGFVVRFAIAMKSIAMAAIFTWSGYNANLPVGAQPATVALGMRILLAVLPVLGLAASFAFTWLFPLHGRRLAEVKAQVQALHDVKAKRAAASGDAQPAVL
jgi:glycoside/pentoside/hexuronide:cation symporter, GPH family